MLMMGVYDKGWVILICLVLFPVLISYSLIWFTYVMNGVLMTKVKLRKTTRNGITRIIFPVPLDNKPYVSTYTDGTGFYTCKECHQTKSR